MKGIVERFRGVGNDPLDVEVIRADKIHSGDIVNGLAVFVDEEVEGNAVLAEVLHVDERRENVLAEFVVDQNLVHLFVCCSAWV